MPIENATLCRNNLAPLHQILGMNGFNAFGASYQFGQDDGIEGPWVAPLFTAGILFILSYLTISAKILPSGPSLLRKVIAVYAFNTAVVEVLRMLFDVNRFALVWAALHNLAEWGLIGHLIMTKPKVLGFWEAMMLFIWVVPCQSILFAPFMAGAGIEQITGIWCDWLLVTLFIYQNIRTDRTVSPDVGKVYRWGMYGAISHMLEILPLVGLLIGLVDLPSIPGSILIAVSQPITFFLYYNFALFWDASLLPAAERVTVDTAAAAEGIPGATAPNGEASQALHYDQTTPYVTARGEKTKGTEPAFTTKVAFAVGTFILGIFTIIVPLLIIKPCVHQPLPPGAIPMPAVIGRGGVKAMA